jgi:F-type H+-transporting ATPase subunit a
MEELPLTALLNKHFGGLALALLNALHITPAHPKAPITNAVAMELLVFALLLLFFLIVRSKLSVENPGGLQHVVEGLHGFIQGQSNEIIGDHSEPYTPYLVSLFIFILVCNLIGLIPGFESPTADPSVPLGFAVISFIYYNLMGVRKQGPLHYALHFTGPVWWLAWLMLPIEIISHLARMLSLTIRLFANMFAGDMVTLVFFSLVPLGVPVLFLGLHIGVSFLQAYIFVLLVTVYLAGAVETAH